MKVLITTDLYKPQVNGVVTSVVNLYESLKAMGVEVKILTLSRSRRSYKEGDIYYVSSFPVGFYPDIRASFSIKNKCIKELIKWRPDIIHTQCEFSTMNFAKIISIRTKAPMVHTYHTMYEHYLRYALKSAATEKAGKTFVGVLLKKWLKAFEYIITPTEKVKENLKNYGFTNPMVVIPTGINLSKFNQEFTEEDKMNLRREMGINPSDKILLSLGRVAKEKNIEKIINHFIEFKKSHKGFSLVVAGGGPMVEELIERYSGEDKIYFTGMISPDQVYKYYKLSDIFVCASQSETQGLTYVEALANGLPILCKYDNCLDGMLEPGYNGYFIDSYKDFEDKITYLTSNPDLLIEMSENALKSSKIYGEEEFAKSVYGLYSKVIKNFKYVSLKSRPIRKVKSIIRTYLD
ncbi:glycosyltransferase [Peptoniphilus catoniae]|uniref:glycosyltransferase n=1 Tax=Peptoniphilus catoniae TaxID=1660341 RepID=UPI0010FECCA4|nr:glycosyltransferase [Peptoniphilus catoniae]